MLLLLASLFGFQLFPQWGETVLQKLTGRLHNLEEAWLKRNKNQLISCPVQPGNLRISEKVCLKRHILGSRVKILKFRDWTEVQKISLSMCKECLIGKRLKIKYGSDERGKQDSLISGEKRNWLYSLLGFQHSSYGVLVWWHFNKENTGKMKISVIKNWS